MSNNTTDNTFDNDTFTQLVNKYKKIQSVGYEYVEKALKILMNKSNVNIDAIDIQDVENESIKIYCEDFDEWYANSKDDNGEMT